MGDLLWIRFDISFPRKPEVIRLKAAGKHRALIVHLEAMCWSGEQGTDGLIETAMLASVGGRLVDAADLVAAGLWSADPDGWRIVGWTKDRVSDSAGKARSAKATRAAEARWHGPGRPDD